MIALTSPALAGEVSRKQAGSLARFSCPQRDGFPSFGAGARPPGRKSGFASAPTVESAVTSAPTDFDFIIGHWQVQHRRLNDRLVGCSEWTEFCGSSTTRKVLQGFGNIEDNLLDFPEGSVHAIAVRSFDPTTKTWAIWWLDGRSPHHLDVPVIGRFFEGVGTFYADDILAGRSIRVRFLWQHNPGSHPRWEQAFSQDGGQSWEVNWTMEFCPVAT